MIDPLGAVYRQMLAETMRPCPEYHPGRDLDPAEQAEARARRAGLATFFGDEPANRSRARRAV